MNSRERVRMALDHREPDRIPFDLGATVLTSIHRDAYQRLRSYLGLPKREQQLMDIIQQIVLVDEDVRERLKVDVRGAAPRSSARFQIEVEEMEGYTCFYDEWGIGWRMPREGGLYYDMFHHPLREARSFADIDAYELPDPLDPTRYEGMRERARQIAEVEGKAVFLGSMSAGFMELTAWTRGFEDYFADFAANQKLLTYLMDRFVDLKLAYWEKALAEVGDYVDVVNEADDFAGQFGTLISPEQYRKIARPRHRKIFDFIHSHSKAKVFFHSCGSIRAVIPDLIEAGVDILNPVQVSATGMDSAELKREFGRELCFWGGGVDTQTILDKGTPEEVRGEVRRRIEDLAPGGGFVFAAVHNIQGDVPPENIMAMWETLQEYGDYPVSGDEV